MIIIRAIIIIFSLVLLSCREGSKAGSEKKKASREVIFYNWKNYTSKKVLKEFEKETGIKVILVEFETRDEQLAMLQSKPGFCDLTNFDSHMASREFLDLKIIKKLDQSKLANVNKITDHFKQFKDVSMPYSYGMTGFAVNRKFVKEKIDDFDFLINPDYRGKVSLLNDPYDCYIMLLFASGLDLNKKMSDEDKKLLDVYCKKIALNRPGFNETFTNLDLLVEGKKWIVQTYSGDASGYKAEHDFVEFVLPGEKFNSWSESICLINNAPNEDNAYKLINYLTTEKAAASFSNEFYFSNVIVGSEAFLSKDVKNDYFINMSGEERAKGVYYYKTKEKMNNMQKTFSQLLEAASDSEVKE